MAAAVVPGFSPNNVAVPWWEGGCSVIPIKANGSKQPVFHWKEYQNRIPNQEEVKSWFEERWTYAGVAVICGEVSGNLEMLELEGRANTPEILHQIKEACIAQGIGTLWDTLTTDGYTELTPAGGLHILYRILGEPVPGNEKVATRPAFEEEYTQQERALKQGNPAFVAIRVLAETRGDGGYVIVAPTSGRSHPSGNPWRTLTGHPGRFISISWESRNLLHQVIRNLLHVNPPSQELVVRQPTPVTPRDPNEPLSPVEDFNLRASWHDEWFTSRGWTVHHSDGGEIFWVRPGKDWAEGHSASTGVREGGQDCLYIWSTSTSLPSQVPLTKFMVYSHYEYNDNMSAAARALRQQGYGAPAHPKIEFGEFDLGFPDPGHREPDDDSEPAPSPPADSNGHKKIPRHKMETLLQDDSGGEVLTDIGYAERMRDMYLNRLRYNSTDKSWYWWESAFGTWNKDAYDQVSGAAKLTAERTLLWVQAFRATNPLDKAIKKLEAQAQTAMNRTRLQGAIRVFQCLDGIASSVEDFDNNLDLLNLANGTLNLATYELLPHSPRHMVTRAFNAAYDDDAKCPNFEHYLADVFPDVDLRSYVQRAIGYSLLGRPMDRTLFLLHGPSGTGKSVFTDVMTQLFGGYGGTAPASTFKQKKQDSTFDLHRLHGKRFITSSEMPEGAQLDEELVKRLTGGDQMSSRGLYEGFQDWKPVCVVWIATNFLPRLNGDDDAMWRRIRTIPMNNIINTSKEEVRGLSSILAQEANGIFNWMLDGLRAYRLLGSLGEPDIVIQDRARYRTDTDTVASWLAQRLEDGTYEVGGVDHQLEVKYAFLDYVTTCKDEGITPLGRPRFIKRLSNLNPNFSIEKGLRTTNIVGLKQISGL